jgi:Tol biopolymer transport system component
MSPRRLPLITLLSLLVFPAAAHALPADSTRILSGTDTLDAALPAPVSDSWIVSHGSLSDDGNYVVFASRADGLVAGDDDRVENVYRKDRSTGAIVLASRADGPAGAPSHADCWGATVSDDGRKVAFVCAGSLDPADTNTVQDIYVRDLVAGTTRLASRASGAAGAVGAGSSGEAMISGNGEFVVFESTAANLHPADGDTDHDVFRRRLEAGQDTVLVSRATGPGQAGNGESRDPSVSDDGVTVAFASAATNLGTNADTNGDTDIYLRDVAAGTTVAVSGPELSDAPSGDGAAFAPVISGQASTGQYYVAYLSSSTNLGPADGNGQFDVYRRAVGNGAVVLVSRAHDDAPLSVGANLGGISDSGAVVGFGTDAAADPADTDDRFSAYARSVASGDTLLIARLGDGGPVMGVETGAPGVSGDGYTFTMDGEEGGGTPDADPIDGNAYVRDLHGTPVTELLARPAGVEPFVNAGARVRMAAAGRTMSADGARTVFTAVRGGLRTNQVWVRDLRSGALILASRTDGPGGTPADRWVDDAVISADGRRVAFVTVARLDPADPDTQTSVYVRDLESGRTWLASRADGAAGASAAGAAIFPALDADGSRVAFLSWAANLGDGDTDTDTDVHVRDLESDRTLLASSGGSQSTTPPSLDAAGRFVAFDSTSAGAAEGDGDAVRDVHVRDLQTGALRVASAAPGGAKGSTGSRMPQLSADGTRVAFLTRAPELLPGPSAVDHVVVRDSAAGTLAVADRADGAGGAPSPDGAQAFALSHDGRVVAWTRAGGFGAVQVGATDEENQIRVRDLVAGTTVSGSRGDGASGEVAAGAAPSLSADGACLAFLTERPLVTGTSPDHRQAYVRALRSGCPAAAPAAPAETDPPVDPWRPLEPADRTAPVLRGVTLTTKGRKRIVKLTASEAATLKVVVKRRKAGTKRYRRIGAFSRPLAAGANRVVWDGKLGGKRLRPGRYRLVLKAVDAAGNRSAPARLAFRVR